MRREKKTIGRGAYPSNRPALFLFGAVFTALFLVSSLVSPLAAYAANFPGFNKDAVTYINRGIGICEEWENSFEVFAEWAFSNGYDDNLTIDRKDNNKGYSPCNCRWATVSEQAYNKRGSYRITHEDKVYTVGEFAKKMKVPHWRIRRSARLNRLTGCTVTKLT